jgi:spore germination protein
MIIYVVKKGDTLKDIASNFEVDLDEIIDINQIDSPDNLVVGQALVVPINSYIVKEGEGLFEISRKLGVSFRNLIRYNNLDFKKPILVGQKLKIPKFAKTAIYTNAYVDPFITSGKELEQITKEAAPFLTYLAPFSYTVALDGTLVAPHLNNLTNIAKDNDVALMLVITNVDEEGFDEEIGRMTVTSEQIQDKILDQAINIAKAEGFKDVHFDLEFLPSDTREDYNNFLLKARDRLHDNDLMLSTALAPKARRDQVGQWYEAHDYKAHGEIADFVVLMTYEWGYTYGLPLAISPIEPVKKVVEYALSEISSDKILLGQNLYGYDWRAPYKIGGEAAPSISPNEAIKLAWENNQSISFDERAQAPYFNYVDKDGREHTVWFEDARSINAKFNLIRDYDLRGISYWRLGYDFPQNWYLLNDQFDIVKL